MSLRTTRTGVAVVAILKGEEPFLDEWIAYHRVLGADHFYLYDNDPRQPLAAFVGPYKDFVTIVPWADAQSKVSGRNVQTGAYEHSLRHIRERWVAFIDGDEFIVLRHALCLSALLQEFEDVGAVLLNWHVFGHNGYYRNPPGLIIEALTRRKATPSRLMKPIAQVEAVESIESAHVCTLHPPFLCVDANHRIFSEELYEGKTTVAHINHYMCRSFLNWIGRVERGDTHHSRDNYPKDKDHRWRFEREACLRKFVELSRDFNEFVDLYMCRYGPAIKEFVQSHRPPRVYA